MPDRDIKIPEVGPSKEPVPVIPVPTLERPVRVGTQPEKTSAPIRPTSHGEFNNN